MAVESFLNQTADHGPKEPFLIFEIEIDRSLGYSRPLGDIVKTSSRIPVGGKFLETGYQDLFLAVRLRFPPSGKWFRSLQSHRISYLHQGPPLLTEQSVSVTTKKSTCKKMCCQLRSTTTTNPDAAHKAELRRPPTRFSHTCRRSDVDLS